MTLVIDTGPLLAALDSADPDHAACARLLVESDDELVVPVLVLAELDYWCHKKMDGRVWSAFLSDVVAGAYTVEAPTGDDLDRCLSLQDSYRDLRLGVVDASVIALCERLRVTRVATLDRRHFLAVRPLHTDALTVLP